MFAGAFMMGANDRLLPPQIPFRFFAAALLFHGVGWGLLLADPVGVTEFSGGPGAGLAGLHAITLGVLLMSAMGAAFQMLPVATRRPLGPVWLCRAGWWLFTPGVALLCAGLLTGQIALWLPGGLLGVTGAVVFGGLVARNLWQVRDLPEVTRHGWVALICLVLMLVLAVLLLGDFSLGWLPDHRRFALLHAVLAAYGVMGSLLLGFSYILIPMFVLSRPVARWVGRWSAGLLLAGIVLACAGIWGESPAAVSGGAVVGLAGYGLYLRAMLQVLAGRMRKTLEPFFRLVFVGWVVLPLSVLPGVAAAWWPGDGEWILLWGWMLIFGGLLTFVTAILQRIMPFLASMHSGAAGGKPILLSRLTEGPFLAIHAVCHVLAVTLVSLGIALSWPVLVGLGCLCGMAGAVFFGIFAMEMMRRYRRHERDQHQT